MKPPPFLIGAGLLFWGWQTGLLWWGLLAAVLVEGAGLLKTRWEFSQPDLDRIWNLCVALFLGGTIYAFFSGDSLTAMSDLLKDNSASSRLATLNQSKRSLFQLLQWLPLMFLPIALAQASGAQEQLDLSTFSWWLRRKRSEPSYQARYGLGLHLGFPYFGCCLFAASTANQRTLWFSAGVVGLVAWALWLHRSRSSGWIVWSTSLVAALGLGVGMHLGMLELQKLVQRLDEVLLARWSSGRSFDAKGTQTHIGAIGRMKLSGRIVLRLETQGHNSPPDLLREATYNLFRSPYWNASSRHFERLTAEANQADWQLQSVPGARHRIRIAGSLPGGEGLLALPHGVQRLEELPALLATNLLGSVRVEDGPGFVQFDTTYSEGSTIDGPPAKEDYDVPSSERPALQEISKNLQLETLAPAAAPRTLERFFAQNFKYSLAAGPEHLPTPERTALARFLLEHRTGHCEYFATATTLLLRSAHIPARYAAGFSVQEKKGRYYVVRERHAHAWCLAWIDGAWRTLDTTPASWGAEEARQASSWESVRDIFSRVWFEFSRWRWGHAEWKRYLLWLIVPLLALTLGKLLWHRQWKLSAPADGRGQDVSAWPGLDSEFFRIQERLIQSGFERQPGETGAAWLQRVGKAGTLPVDGLDALLAAHYRLRFDPHGLDLAERQHLRQQAEAWLERARATP